VLENGIKFKVDVVNGQKTGLFLDMREMRELISKLSTKKRLLNCFGYNGGFSLYAARNQAKTTTIDISKPAILGARENFEINKFDLNEHTFIDTDVFTYISENSLENFDIIILDPPAFAKKKSDINNAIRAYKKLNRITFSKAQKGALVLTCSCSFHIDEQTFLSIVREALLESNKSGKIISKHRLAYDHPINIFHTENNYLKSLLIALD
jgi:23S rRNA (cytosine1962-C5)-methyltransferase